MAEPEALDAYVTAKPDEPTFSLQGGDPLAGPLIRLWAAAARTRIGLGKSLLDIDELKTRAETYGPENERESDDLKRRATIAEQTSWKMDSYLKGQIGAEEAENPDEKLSVAEQVTLFDLRLSAALRISGMFSELTEIMERLEAAKFDGTDNLWHIKLKINIAKLRELHQTIEPESYRQRYARKR